MLYTVIDYFPEEKKRGKRKRILSRKKIKKLNNYENKTDFSYKFRKGGVSKKCVGYDG